MKYITQKLALVGGMLALMAAVAPAPSAQAQEATAMKTMAVVSISGYDQLLKDLDYIGQQIERPGLPQMLEGGLAAVTGGRGTVGLDKTRPWGVAVQTDGQQFEPLAFLPVKDLKAIITTVGAATGAEPEKDEAGIYEIQAGPQPIFVKEVKDWAYITKSKETLANPPEDPTKLLDGLNTEYDFAVRVYVQNIPQVFRNMAIQQLRQGVEMGLDRLPDEDEEAYEMRKKLVQNQLKQVTMLVEETDTVTFGWSIEPDKQRTFLNVSMTALPNSKLARQAAQLNKAKTDFAGFLDSEAAIKLGVASETTNKEDIQQSVAMIDALTARATKQIDEDTDLPSDEARAAIKEALVQAMDVLKKTVEEGKIDGGMIVKLDPTALTVAAGARVADGPALEGALRKLAEVAADEPGFSGVEWGFAEHEGVKFHRMNAPVEEEDAQKILGEKLEVVAGIGAKSFYFALGKNNLDTLKGVIDASKSNAGKSVSPVEMVISVGDIARFAAAQDKDPKSAKVAEALKGSEGKDNVLVTLKTIPNGFMYHVELEQAVLKAIGAASTPSADGGDDF